MKKVIQQLALEARHTTFLVSHANIDEKHAEDVDKAIVQNCKKPDDWANLAEVMQTSLRLQSAMLDAVLEEYQALKANASDRYRFLNGRADT
jgi:pyrroloquinoline quinone (PQQ) biosynthesis protein C